MTLLYLSHFCSEQKPVLYAGKYPVYERLDEVKPADVLNAVLNTDVTSDIVCMQKMVGVTDAAVFWRTQPNGCDIQMILKQTTWEVGFIRVFLAVTTASSVYLLV